MKIISIVLTLLFTVGFIAYLYCASKRKTMKNLFSLGANVVTFVESFLVTKLFIFLLGNNIARSLSNFIQKLLKITEEEWIKNTSINDFTTFLSNMVLGIFVFLLAFILLYALNHFLKKKVFKATKKVSYYEYQSKSKDSKIGNMAIGLVSFAIVSFAFLFPVGAFLHLVTRSAEEVSYTLPSPVNTVVNNPVLKLYSNGLSEGFLDQITKMKNDKNSIQTSKELNGISTIAFAAMGIDKEDTADKNVKIIQEKLSSTYLIPTFVSEFCSNAAYRFKNNQSFMGMTLEIPTDNTRMIFMDVLEIVSKWERQTLIDDIGTVFDVYGLLKENNVKDLEDTDALMDALAKDEFSEELFLQLFGNSDFKTLIPTFMNFGIETILDSSNISSNGGYINTMNLDSMSQEEIKKEARIFSLAIRQIIEINHLKGQNVTMDDVNRIMNNLNEIKNSKLLNDALYNLIYKLARNI